MNRPIIAGLLCLVFPYLSFAEPAPVVQTGEVVVTATRIPQRVNDVLADVTVIDREQIEQAGQSSLPELLQSQPGLEIAGNGGAGKSVNLFLRGSTAQQVLVLVDGLRMGSATLGTTTLQDIPLAQIERIEIVRGAASSFYGSDAIGGVVQIFTRKDEGQVSASIGYGTYNTRQLAAHVSNAIGDLHYALNVSSHETNGFSSLRVTTGLDADNDNYRNLTVSGSLSYDLAQGHELGVQFYQSSNHINYDDGTNFPANQDDIQRSYAITSRNQFLPYWLSSVRLGKSVDDSDSLGGFGRGIFRTYQTQFGWQNDFALPLGTLSLAYDRLNENVEGNPGGATFTTPSRLNNGYLASYFVDAGAYSLQASLRRDYNSQFGSHTTGNVSLGYRVTPAWRVTGNFGTAFRAPTFDDLYWPFQNFGAFGTYQGNPNLRPETSRNKEIGLVYETGGQRASATVYHNEVKNLIVAAQGLFNDFPANIGSATMEGITLGYQGQLFGTSVRSSVDIQNPTDDATGLWLARRSHKHASLWLGHTFGALEIGGEIIASGKRFDDAANTRKLDGYALLNLTASYALNPDWTLSARANNVLDKQYTLATQFGTPFNTPDANVFVSLRYAPK